MISAPFAVRDDVGATARAEIFPDIGALHRAFLTERSTLVTWARSELGADADTLAPQVVESAFVAAWDARTALPSEDVLRRFLFEEIRHEASRTLRRRTAAHRLSSPENGRPAHDTVWTAQVTSVDPDPETEWRHVELRIHSEPDRERALDQAAAATRHEAAGHIANFGRRATRWWTWVLLALTLGAGALGFTRLLAAS